MPLCAQAEIFRCTSAAGAVTYQEIACPESAPGRATGISDVYPQINHAERDRLLQREAALEERLIKRAQIDSAERIARDDRIARERELQASREAQQVAAGPVLLIRPLHRPRVTAPHRRPFQPL